MVDVVWKDEEGFLAKIQDEQKFGVFLDMGTGKTGLLLGLIDYQLFVNCKKFLIITPKMVSLENWQNEILKWDNFRYMSPYVRLIDGTPDERKEVLKNTGEFCIDIVSSSLTEWLIGDYVKVGKKKKLIPNKATPKYDVIIVDECSQFKSTKSNRFKALKKLVKGKLFLLSGTPFSNIKFVEDKHGDYYKDADELYYAFNLLDIFKNSLTEFRNSFCYSMKWEPYNYRMKQEVYDALIEELNKHCIRKKLHLDIKVRETKVYCPVDEARMKKLKEDYIVKTDNLQNITSSNKADMINTSLQLANGFVYDETGKAVRINNFKFEKLQDILFVTGGNVIIYYMFKEDKDFLLKNLVGSATIKNKKQIDEWKSGKIKYAILSPFSAKFGLNLQSSGDAIIHYGVVWSAESVLQSNARLARRGRIQDVDIYYLLAENSFDDYVYDSLISKITVTDNFISYVES